MKPRSLLLKLAISLSYTSFISACPLLPTTTIGSYPKPSYLSVPGWSSSQPRCEANLITEHSRYLSKLSDTQNRKLDKATREVVQEQVSLGIDIPTDGEQKRENHILYHCRHLNGISFEKLEKAYDSKNNLHFLPTVVNEVRPAEAPFLIYDFLEAQKCTERPVKITIPGPLSISYSLKNQHYSSREELCKDLAKALNKEILALAASGCKWIQVDEPSFSRAPDEALDYGISMLELCFKGLPKDVNKILHICRGYPCFANEENFPKAQQQAYHKLASAIDLSSIDALSIEDSYNRNSLGLFGKFKNTKIILGVLNVCRSRIESIEEIQSHIEEVLSVLPPEKLIIAPDCGFILLDRSTTRAKLRNLSEAVRRVRKNLKTV